MIPVPQAVLEVMSAKFTTRASDLVRYGGGREDSDGIVYVYPYQNRRRLLKIMAIPLEDRQRGLFCLEERLKFMRFMGERGARIAFPQLSPQGILYETCLHEAHLWVGYIMEIAAGKTPREDAWDADFFRKWGQTVGMLHHLTWEYPSWQSSIDPTTGLTYLYWREEWDGFYKWCPDEDVKAKWLELRAQLEALPMKRNAFGFIHNDPHLWNLLWDGSQITLLDFDVANHHWFMTDIAIACQSILFAHSGGMDRPVQNREKLLEFLGFFLEGYQDEHHLSPDWLNRLDLFIAYRRILLFTVMHGWIQSKPEWHAAWKEMILTQPQVAGETWATQRK